MIMVCYLYVLMVLGLLRHPLANIPNADLVLRRYAGVAGQIEEELKELHYADWTHNDCL